MRGAAGVALALVAVACASPAAPPAGVQAPHARSPEVDTKAGATMSASTVPESEPDMGRGRALVERLVAQKFDEVVRDFDATLAAGLPEGKLRGVWEQIVSAAGAFQAIEAARVERDGSYRRVVLTCRFERGRLDAKVVYGTDDKVAGLFFAPTPPPYSDPPYVDRSAFTEREVTVGAGEWALPGALSTPNGDGPFPAIVLVHGSGPNDRDESVGANKPFKDLAGGLASRRIAVLRFDKRTKVHGKRIGKDPAFTVDQESVEDALAAVELLRTIKAIDPKRIVVAGHSLGGELAPRIGARSEHVAGLVILAGSTRPLQEVLVEQRRYIADLDGKRTPEADAKIREAIEAGKRITELQHGAAPKPDEWILGAGVAYWIDLGKYDALATARALRKPIFVAQGGRDYQVTTVDFERWKKALAGRKDVVSKFYPELNHLFGSGVGKSAPAEYEQRTPVDARLVDDLAAWVNAR
jgi:dienelactone hydrolase